MAKTKNSSKIIAIISAIILFLSLSFAILPNLDNSTSTQVQASTLTEAQLQQRRSAPGLYQTNSMEFQKDGSNDMTWDYLVSNEKIITNNTSTEPWGTFYVYDLSLAGDLVCGAVSNLTSMDYSFALCESLTSIDISNWNTSSVTSMLGLFRDSKNLTSITFGSNFNTSNVDNMKGMFYECNALKSIDLSKFDTSNVSNMELMFYGCSSVETLDVSKFNTENVTTIRNMFGLCSKLKNIDVSSFDTSNVTDMRQLFVFCTSLTQANLSNFNTEKVTLMTNLFGGCTLLERVDVSSFNTSKVIDMRGFFAKCVSLKALDVSNFDTRNVINMSGMFKEFPLKKLDISNFDTSKVTDMSSMFKDSVNLEKLYLNNFNILSDADTTDMFSGCNNLKFIKTPQTVANKTFSDLSISFESAVDGMTGEDIASSDYMPTNTFICFNGYQPTFEDTGVATNLFSLAVTGLIIIALAVVCFKKKKLR